METQGNPPVVLDALHGDALPPACRIEEMPDRYGRLLVEYIELLKTLDVDPYMSIARSFLMGFNPRFQYRFWTSRHIRDFVRVPDAVRQDLPFAAVTLQSLQPLSDPQLRALARCSNLNVGKLTSRLFFGGSSKGFVTVAALFAAAKGLKEVFGLDLAGYVPFFLPVIVPLLVGLGAGAVFNLFVWYQRLRLVRALDDIISIATAARSSKQ